MQNLPFEWKVLHSAPCIFRILKGFQVAIQSQVYTKLA